MFNCSSLNFEICPFQIRSPNPDHQVELHKENFPLAYGLFQYIQV